MPGVPAAPNRGTWRLQLDAKILCLEPPLDGYAFTIALRRPGTGFAAASHVVGNPPRQAQPGHDGDFDLGEVQPAAVLRRVVDLQALRDATSAGSKASLSNARE